MLGFISVTAGDRKGSTARRSAGTGSPAPIRPRSPELPVHLVPRTRCGGIADRGLHRLAADHASQPHLLHQPRRRAACDFDPFAPQLPPDLPYAVDLEILLPDPADTRAKTHIPFYPRQQTVRIHPAARMLMVGRRRDRQRPADRLDTVDLAMRVDERDHPPCLRPLQSRHSYERSYEPSLSVPRQKPQSIRRASCQSKSASSPLTPRRSQ